MASMGVAGEHQVRPTGGILLQQTGAVGERHVQRPREREVLYQPRQFLPGPLPPLGVERQVQQADDVHLGPVPLQLGILVFQHGDPGLLQPLPQLGITGAVRLVVARGVVGRGDLSGHSRQGNGAAQVPVLPVYQVAGKDDQVRGLLPQGRLQLLLDVRAVHVGDLGNPQAVQPLQPLRKRDLIVSHPKFALEGPHCPGAQGRPRRQSQGSRLPLPLMSVHSRPPSVFRWGYGSINFFK